jgi:argininosuccinate synthase
VTILAPARDWPMNETELAAYARNHRVAPLSAPGCRIDQNLGGRVISFPEDQERPELVRPKSATQSEPAALGVRFEGGVPVAINDVPMSPVELVECLALIAGRHGVGRFEGSSHGRTLVYDAPAAAVLRVARAAVGGPSGVARLSVLSGTCTVLDPNADVVNLA